MRKRVVLITGGSAGIGLATAMKFAREGDQVIITGRDEKRLYDAAGEIDKAIPIVADAGKMSDIISLFKTVKEKTGKIDVLFANAGIGLFKPFMEISEDDFDLVSNVNYKGTFFTVQQALNLMPAGGNIVINSSWTHHRGLLSSSLYSSTKAAIAYLVKSLAGELTAKKININAISPGYTNTSQFNEFSLPEETAKAFREQVPQKRFGTPDEIAEVVYFLASEKASYINGQDIVVDGGLIAVHRS